MFEQPVRQEGESSRNGVMAKSLSSLALNVRQLVIRFRADLLSILDQDLVSIYLFGAIAFPRFEPRAGDIDFYAFLKRPLTASQKRALDAMHRTHAREFPLGIRIDGFYIPLPKARGRAIPKGLMYSARGRLHHGGRDDAWALHREHFHQGAYVLVHGPKPEAIVPRSSWPEIERALDLELLFARRVLRKHTPYAVLNLCRLIHSYETKKVVLSKLQAAKWALKTLPNAWQSLIRSALKAYLGRQNGRDLNVLKTSSVAFAGFALARILESEHLRRHDARTWF